MERLALAPTLNSDTADAQLAAEGDAEAFERLYRKHSARIHSLARRMIGPEEADDVTQDVFVRAWRKLDLFRGDAQFGTWLYRLAVNVILGKRTGVAKYRDRHESVDVADLALASRRERVDLRMDVDSALATLPKGARQVFVLHDVEGYTHEEIAEMLDVTAGTSKSQLHRARMTLRQHLV
ncbi:MAG: sigma-70 family RNA polymerase sigma factor [Longimicrobiales bacterium]